MLSLNCSNFVKFTHIGMQAVIENVYIMFPSSKVNLYPDILYELGRTSVEDFWTLAKGILVILFFQKCILCLKIYHQNRLDDSEMCVLL